MNQNLLEAEMKKHGDTLETLARKLGKAPQTLCNKKNGNNADFTRREMDAIRHLYGLNGKQMMAIFFDN